MPQRVIVSFIHLAARLRNVSIWEGYKVIDGEGLAREERIRKQKTIFRDLRLVFFLIRQFFQSWNRASEIFANQWDSTWLLICFRYSCRQWCSRANALSEMLELVCFLWINATRIFEHFIIAFLYLNYFTRKTELNLKSTWNFNEIFQHVI